MIQLSDTKATPGLGGLPRQKPKAGGDASAFALALGGLVPESKPAAPIALTGQSTAAPGNALPGGKRGKGEETTDWDIQLIALPDIFAFPVEPVNLPIGYDAGSLVTVTAQLEVPIARDGASAGRATSSVDIPGTVPVLDEAGRVATAPLAAPTGTKRSVVVDPPSRHISERIAEKSAPAITAALTATRAKAAPDTAPIGAASQMPIAGKPASDPYAPKSERGKAPILFDPSIKKAATAALQRDRAGLPVVPDPTSQRIVPRPAAILAGEAVAATSQSALPDMAKTTAPMQETATTSAAPISRGDPAPVGRPALSVRFESMVAVAKSRSDATPGKASSDAGLAAPAAAPSALPINTEPATPIPAKFVIADRPANSTAPSAPRRVAITPVVTPAATRAAIPMTVADLIPTEQRPRAGIAPVTMMADPASIGLSAPVEPVSPAAEPAPIDTHAAEWIEGMIDQIEVMRDARADGSNTTTRIRLSPDALGAIEIVLSGEGEAIDVRINADTPAARTLLAEAAPRLTDMAEARGLKLGQGDAGQPGQQQAQRQQPNDDAMADRRRTADAADAGGDTDERIA